MPLDQRARCRSPRKMLRRARFPHRISDSDWKADCRRQRRISCPSCFRPRTYYSALPYSKTQVLALLVAPRRRKRSGMYKRRTGARLRLRLRKELPLRDAAAASAAPDPCLAPPFRLPVTQPPSAHPPRLAALGCFVALARRSRRPAQPRDMVVAAVRGVGGAKVWLDRLGNGRLPAREIFVKKSGTMGTD
jgi:hypothetical protein